MGIAGGLAGIALGYGGAKLVSAVVPPLSATVGQSSGSATPVSGTAPFGGAGRLADTARTISVHLTAPVTISVILLAVLLAIAGSLVAGTFGGWRAARLRPAAALARIQ
jgi:ABC-type lipoprotein release transport system permease subunit